MTEKANSKTKDNNKAKPQFNFNFGGIAEEEKQSEESHST